MSFYFYFCNIIKVNNFLYRFIILLHLMTSSSLTRPLLIPNAYVSIESFDCILLLSFELKSILLISLVKKLCFSLLNLCCIFNIDLLFLMNSIRLFFKLSMLIFFFSTYFILSSSLVTSKQFL